MSAFQVLFLTSAFVFSSPVTAQILVEEGASPTDALRLNQIQVIGSHNSYKAAIDSSLYQLMIAVTPSVQALDYAHPPLTDQLNLGLRSLELDLYHDPEGGRYAKPLGLSMVRRAGKEARTYDPQGKMLKPGFKVFHVQDIDFRSNCLTFADALVEIRNWSERHPRHLPVIITLNLKEDTIELPGAVEPLRFDAAALDEIDKELLSTLGREELILPDDVRGDYGTLEAAVRASEWPTLAWARGRFLLVLDESGHQRDEYLADHPALRGRVMFVESEPGHPEAAVMIRNDPLTEGKRIAQLIRQGYLVRTRADSGTREARSGDFSRFKAAKKSGAQVISTDFYLVDRRFSSDYRIRFDQGRCYRLNPITGQPQRDRLPISDQSSPDDALE